MFKSFKDLLRKGEKVVGIFSNTGNAEMIELAAYGGFQFTIIDNEHGCWGTEANANLVRAADAAGIIPLVRVANIDETEIKHALDVGAAGVMIPGIGSVQAAEKAMELAKYAPAGRRGACPFVRANQYRGDNRGYFAQANQEVAVVLLIEGREGLAAYDDILEVAGVDCVFFGPYDMSVSMGVPGDVTNPKVVDAIRGMAKKANEKGVFCGMLAHDDKESLMWFESGIDYIAAIGDMALFLEACKAMTVGIKQGRAVSGE